MGEEPVEQMRQYNRDMYYWWNPEERELPLKERLWKYIEGSHGQSFNDVDEFFGHDTWAVSTAHLLNLNIMLWIGLPEDVAVAICELHNENRIQYIRTGYDYGQTVGSEDTSVCFATDISIPIERTVRKKTPSYRYPKTRWLNVWITKAE